MSSFPGNTTFFITNTEPTGIGQGAPRRGGGGQHSGNNVSLFSKSSAASSPFTMDSSDGESVSSISRPLSRYGGQSPVLSQDPDLPFSSDASFGVTSFQNLSDLQIDSSTVNSMANSPPQLVMPRVALPSRRPFTENGLKIGKLKVLVAGGDGSGKTSLIRAIAQTCKELVYIEDANPVYTPEEKMGVEEIYASTKPCPLFWMSEAKKQQADTSDSTPRPSLVHSASSVRSDESALDRNVCFVDCAGSCGDDMVVDYLESKFRETANVINISYAQVVNLLTSSSSLSEFSHVDVCFYMIQDKVVQYDIDYMSRISNFTPVIPIVAKSDRLTEDEILHLKVMVLKELDKAGIKPFLFDTQLSEAIKCGEEALTNPSIDRPRTPENCHNPLLFPCAVASVEAGEPEMLASVLMSADYSPQLEDSELADLCSYVFSEHGSAWLRYVAAKKFIDWTICFQLTNGLNLALMTTGNAKTKNDYRGDERSRRNDDNNNNNCLVPYSGNKDSNLDEPEYIVNLPSSVFTTQPKACDRAQRQTARWAMQMEQTSRSENAYSLRAHSAALKRSRVSKLSRRNDNKRYQPHISNSISNIDPLGLKKLANKTFNYTVKALGFLLSIKLVSFIYSRALSTCMANWLEV
jgi:hypothetical protein